MSWQFVLAGLAVGGLVGMTGMGGGSLMTPLLILAFNFDPRVAVGTDILHSAVFKSFGGVQHRRLGHVHARLVAWMLIGSVPLSLLGVQVASGFGPSAQATMSRLVGFALFAGAAGSALKTVIRRTPAPDAPLHLSPRQRSVAVALGAGGGFVVGLTSVGSGIFFGLTILLVYPLTAQKIVGTDVAHAAVLLWAAGLSHLLHGNVDLHAMGWLLAGSVPGVIAGSRLSIRVPERGLRLGFSLVLLLTGIKLVGVPYADEIDIAGLAAGAVTLLALGLRRLVGPDPAFRTRLGRVRN